MTAEKLASEDVPLDGTVVAVLVENHRRLLACLERAVSCSLAGLDERH
jgi:hypothetical protein